VSRRNEGRWLAALCGIALVACVGALANPSSSPATMAVNTAGAASATTALRSLSTFNIDGDHAVVIARITALIEAYNRGDLETVLALVSDRIVWADCDYRAGTSVGVIAQSPSNKALLATYLRGRFAEHDQLRIARLYNNNPDDSTGRVGGIEYGIRTSDTLRSLGFPNGIRGPQNAKMVFDGDGRIAGVSNASTPAQPQECRPQ
jgi:hypothetical protein